MRVLRERVRAVVARQAHASRFPPVLLEGETGTGKTLVAQLIHRAGPRRDKPFVDLNCAAIPETLLETELFGHEKGAFTGADHSRQGLLQAAHGGSLFLDEIALLPESLQAKLLKAVEERTVRRVGSTRSESIDVWIIAASNANLAQAVAERCFREDLYHRLSALRLTLPPLRERASDVIELAEHFLRRACKDYGLGAKTLAVDAHRLIQSHAWPGNVRELANAIERAALMAPAPTVAATDFELVVARPPAPGVPAEAAPAAAPPAPRNGGVPGVALGEIRLDAAVREHVISVLESTEWNVTRAAAMLGVARNTLRARMAQYGLPAGLPGRPRKSGGRAEPDQPSAAQAEAALSTPVRWSRLDITLLRVAILNASETSLGAPARAMEETSDKVEAFGGRVEDGGRSGIVAVFGHDGAEDAARRGALAAIALLNLAARLPTTSGLPLRVAAALHVAPAEIGAGGGRWVISPESRRTGWAALDALITRAGAGEVVASAAAAPLLRRAFELEASGNAPRGLGRLFRVVAPAVLPFAVGARRILSPIVGRDHEMTALETALTDVARHRQGRVVDVVGDAGIGKSRLLHEFRRRAAREAAGYWSADCSSPNRPGSYFVIAQLLRQQCAIGDADSLEVVADKIRATFADASSRPHLLYLQALAGLKASVDRLSGTSPDVRHARTIGAVRHAWAQAARRRPLVIEIENVHWIDGASRECLTAFAEDVDRLPVLLLCTYRPTFQAPWASRPSATQLALQPLSSEASAQLFRAIAPTTVLNEAAAHVIERADGNPFFIEELACALGDGEPAPHLPATVKGVVLARAARLDPRERAVLDAAAVIGDDFSVDILATAVDRRPEHVQQCLERLHQAELLYALEQSDPTRHAFKHALARDAVIDGLAPEDRRRLHGRVAAALATTGVSPARLAHHRTEAGLTVEAILAWGDAGREALVQGATRDAITYLERGLALLPGVDDQEERTRCELDLRLALGSALILLEGYAAPRVEAAYTRAKDLCEAVEDHRAQFDAWYGLWLFHHVRGHHRDDGNIARRLLAIAERDGDRVLLMRAHLSVGMSLFFAGEFGSAHEHLERTAALYDPVADHDHLVRFGNDPGTMGVGFLARCLAVEGQLDRALAIARDGLRQAERREHPFHRIVALCFTAFIHDLRREYPEMLVLAERFHLLAREHGLPHWTAIGHATCGRALAGLGRLDEGIPRMREAIDTMRKAGTGMARSYWLVRLAEAYETAGRVTDGLAAVEDALRFADESGEDYARADLGRLRAELLRRSGAPIQACVSVLSDAREAARRQGARLFELEVAAALARQQADTPDADAARIELARTVNAFREGVDTPTVAAARGLLARSQRRLINVPTDIHNV